MRYFYSILGIVFALFYLKYNYKITNLLGPFPTIERYLGPGTTYFFHKLIAIVIIIFSVLWFFGAVQSSFETNNLLIGQG